MRLSYFFVQSFGDDNQRKVPAMKIYVFDEDKCRRRSVHAEEYYHAVPLYLRSYIVHVLKIDSAH